MTVELSTDASLANASSSGWQPRVSQRVQTAQHLTRVLGSERLEPYEGKLSRTVLRGGWAGNSLPPLDPVQPSRTCFFHGNVPALVEIEWFSCRPSNRMAGSS